MTNPAGKNPTVQDVAAAAGVSVATVSRALGKPDKVSESTRKRVIDAVEATGYTVNQAARNLRKQQTDTIVIMVPNIGNSVFSNVVEGIESVFAENNINVLIADTQKATMSPSNARNYFSKNSVDGMIILDGLMPLEVLQSGQESPPIVFAGEWRQGTELPVVCIDDAFGAKLVAEHLCELGHQQIGQVTGPLNHLPGQIRAKSFDESLRALGCQSGACWNFEADFSLNSGAAAASAWKDLPQSEQPSAVFCAGDEIAFGFIAALAKAGIKVPDGVSVVGYDDLQVAEHYVPALTTIHQPRRTMGIKAAQTLLALINDKPFSTPSPIQPWLVKRQSTLALK